MKGGSAMFGAAEGNAHLDGRSADLMPNSVSGPALLSLVVPKHRTYKVQIKEPMMNPTTCIAAVTLFLSMPFAVEADVIFDSKVIDEVRTYDTSKRVDFFEETYKGKRFSDSGRVNLYAQQNRGKGWYIQIDAGDGSNFKGIYCVIADDENNVTYKALREKYPVGTNVVMSGIMREWITFDSTIRLEDANTFNSSIPLDSSCKINW
jgi:hypothetical protein